MVLMISGTHFRNGFYKMDKMKFDKVQYRFHCRSQGILYFVVAFIVLVVGVMSGQATIRFMSIVFWGISIFISVPFLIELALNSSKQQQFFDKKDLLHIHLVKSATYPFCSANWVRFYEYEIVNINKIRKTFFSIVICGNINCTVFDVWNNRKTRYDAKVIEKARIPRNFTNEEQILNLDIEKYNQQQLKTAKRKDREISRFLREEGEE
jgi:hypothetical protein